MEIIKRQIQVKLGDDIYLKIPLNQNIEDIGLLTDFSFQEGVQIDRCSGGLPLNFMNDGITSQYYRFGNIEQYVSDSKLEVVRTYDDNNRYIEGFDIKRENYINFEGESIIGVDRVINVNGQEIVYTVDAKRDLTLGTEEQSTGILYTDNPVSGVTIPNEFDSDITNTLVQYRAEGWNETNISTDPQIQEEYLLGIISQPEIESDVFIDRTDFSVLDRHLRLSEVESLDHLIRYGNGYYKINRD
jgi:hypothetical protein